MNTESISFLPLQTTQRKFHRIVLSKNKTWVLHLLSLQNSLRSKSPLSTSITYKGVNCISNFPWQKWHKYVEAPEHNELHSTAYIFSTILVLQLQFTCFKTSNRYSSHKLRIRKFGIVHKSTFLSASPFIARIQRKKETSGDVLFQSKRGCIFSAGWNGDDRPLEMSWLASCPRVQIMIMHFLHHCISVFFLFQTKRSLSMMPSRTSSGLHSWSNQDDHYRTMLCFKDLWEGTKIRSILYIIINRWHVYCPKHRHSNQRDWERKVLCLEVSPVTPRRRCQWAGSHWRGWAPILMTTS